MSKKKPEAPKFPISKRPIPNAIVISDTHFGCQNALMHPDGGELDGGSVVKPSALQVKLWNHWQLFWGEWVPMATKKEPFVLILNGDTTDGRHHGATSQWSQNLNDQRRHALKVLRPLVQNPNCAALYVVRGTEAHVGPGAENEETLAEELGAVKDPSGNFSRCELWLRLGKGLIHAMHHIGTSGSSAYESTAIMKELAESYAEAGRWERESPNVIAR